MNHHAIAPNVLVVDLEDVIREFSKYNDFYSVYALFPLQDIIKTILAKTAYDHDDFLWEETMTRLDRDNTGVDYNNLGIFFELLTWSIDETIRHKSPRHIDTGHYIFDQWVDHTSLLLIRNDFQ